MPAKLEVLMVRIEQSYIRGRRPAVKLVYVRLREADGPLAQHEIADDLGLGIRCVREALNELVTDGLVKEEYNLENLREKHYYLID